MGGLLGFDELRDPYCSAIRHDGAWREDKGGWLNHLELCSIQWELIVSYRDIWQTCRLHRRKQQI